MFVSVLGKLVDAMKVDVNLADAKKVDGEKAAARMVDGQLVDGHFCRWSVWSTDNLVASQSGRRAIWSTVN